MSALDWVEQFFYWPLFRALFETPEGFGALLGVGFVAIVMTVVLVGTYLWLPGEQR